LRDRERIGRIAAHHERDAETEAKRLLGDDPLYDGIAQRCVEPCLPKKGRILDAGGGAGVWSSWMAGRTDGTVVLFDVAFGLLKAAKERRRMDSRSGRRIEILGADLREMPFGSSCFDFALCEGDPIAICGDPNRAVKELSRVLKTGGYLAAGVDSTIYRAYRALSRGASPGEMVNFLSVGKSPAEDGAAFESKSFTPTEFTSMLKNHGLQVVRMAGRPIGLGPNMLDAFVSAIPQEERRRIFESEKDRTQLIDFLERVYQEPYLAAMGSHLFVLAKKS